MRILLITLMATLTIGGCGASSDAAKASGKTRLFDSQRDALDKAKGVNDTLLQADAVRRAEEEKQAH
ncbi:MAG TPA: hypothetical protein VK466_00525 [Terriglobales bacterium]|nr:hypothetical protein [Terriglobales bacterium]